MAWHSKRANIKHRKAAQDQKKAKIYAKAAKVIQLAAKQWDDPSLNPALDVAIKSAKQVWLNKDAIQRAIDTWAWNSTGEELVEIFYEGYGPGGAALYIKAITSNTNRSWANIRAILSSYGWSLGQPNSVARQFDEMGEIVLDWLLEHTTSKWKNVATLVPLDTDELEMTLLESEATDREFENIAEDDSQEQIGALITTTRDGLLSTQALLESNNYSITHSWLIFVPQNLIDVSEREQEKLERLIDALDDDDDVDTIWHSAA